MKTHIKVCGITDIKTVLKMADLGVDAAGFVLSESPRRIDVDRAVELVASTSQVLTTVAVLRHPTMTEIADVLDRVRPDFIQTEPYPDAPVPRDRYLPVFHDSVFVEAVIGAYDVGMQKGTVHLEGPGRGGRGISVDLERATSIASKHRLILAGGMTPDNVADRIKAVRPWGVDVSSGVESSPGIKDIGLIRAFVAAVRGSESKGDGN